MRDIAMHEPVRHDHAKKNNSEGNMRILYLPEIATVDCC